MEVPRIITAAEILEERSFLRTELGYIPHGTGTGWSSYFWVSCDCPNCRDNYDPTGEESAKYLNMDVRSWFNGQSEMPSFAFSKIAKDSYLYHLKPGFYLGDNHNPMTFDEICSAIQYPLECRPQRILHVLTKNTWDEFLLLEDGTGRKRRSYKDGRALWGETPPILLEDMPSVLRTVHYSV